MKESADATLGAGSTERDSAYPVLWIDDAVESDDPLVRHLTANGLPVTIAHSGKEGLDRALHEHFSVILLDLQLPDTWGTAVLQQLKCADADRPIIVISGFGYFDDAFAVARLGATNFIPKPLCDEDAFLSCVRAAAHHETPDQLASAKGLEPERLTEALVALDRSMERNRTNQSTVQAVHTLVRVSAAPELSLRSFIGCAQALKAGAASNGFASRSKARSARDFVRGAVEARTAAMPSPVLKAVAYLEAAARSGVPVSERNVAASLSMSVTYLGYVVRRHTGFTFRLWRWSAFVRQAAMLLTQTDEQVAQIAYRLGYEYPGQLNRDFANVLGLSPTQYRRIGRSGR